jgi:hypothetical protein
MNAGIVAGLCFLFFLLRSLSPFAAFPGFESDAGGHAAVIASMLTRADQFFVWPPPYSGIFGSHLLALVFAKCGMPVTQAMLLVSDAALVACGYSVWCLARKFCLSSDAPKIALLLFAVGSVPLFSSMRYLGFYAQCVGYGFYALSLCFALGESYSARRKWIGIIFLGLAGFCYPDGLVWVPPVLLWPNSADRKKIFPWSCWLLAMAVSAFIFKAQMKLLHLEGAGGVGWEDLGTTFLRWSVLVAVGALLVSQLRSSLVAAVLFYALVVGTLAKLGVQPDATTGYYARKNFYFLVVMLPLLGAVSMTSMPQKIRWICVMFAAFCLVFVPALVRHPVGAAWDRVVRPRAPLNRLDEHCVREMKVQAAAIACNDLMALPGASPKLGYDGPGERITRTSVYNALLGHYRVGGGLVTAPQSALMFDLGVWSFENKIDLLQRLDPKKEVQCWLLPSGAGQSGFEKIKDCDARVGVALFRRTSLEK